MSYQISAGRNLEVKSDSTITKVMFRIIHHYLCRFKIQLLPEDLRLHSPTLCQDVEVFTFLVRMDCSAF